MLDSAAQEHLWRNTVQTDLQGDHVPGDTTRPDAPQRDTAQRDVQRSSAQRVPNSTMLYVGASNFSRGLPAVWAQLGRAIGGSVDLLSFCGHGRSYCGPSSIGPPGFRRHLAGIEQAIRQSRVLQKSTGRFQGSHQVRAVFGDFGNDLAFGFGAVQVVNVVRRCVAQLPPGTKQAWIMPPLAGVSDLGRGQFAVLSKLIYPGRDISRTKLLCELAILDTGLRDLQTADSASIELIELSRSWMGWDRIHVRRRMLRPWAQRILEAIAGEPALGSSPGENGLPTPGNRVPALARLGLRCRSCDIHFFGRRFKLETAQPCHDCAGRGTLSLY